MTRDKTTLEEDCVPVRRGKSRQKGNEAKKISSKAEIKKTSKKHEKVAEANKQKVKKDDMREMDVEEKKVKRRRVNKKRSLIKEDDISEEPEVKKKKKNSNKINVNGKSTQDKTGIHESKGKHKLKVDVNIGMTNDEAKPTTDDEGKSQTLHEVSKKKRKAEDEPVPRPVKYERLGDGPTPVPSTGRKYIGCHVSGAGGVWNAFENAELCKAESFALFLRNQRQWNAKPLDEGTIDKWCDVSQDYPPHLILPHGSYLMNLGSPVPETLEKSRNMLLEELQRCEKLQIPHYNFHPGSTLGKISREECCKTIAESINLAHSQTKAVICVLENMSCQGFTIGGDLHELRVIIEHVKDKSRVGVCIDTCHAHAAGYDLSTEAGFQELLDDFGKIIGWQFLRGLHINDSKGKVGDHQDRHENIGRGTIGLEGFRRVMNCEKFNDIPLILETPWTSNDGYAKEIKKLNSLVNN
ncbi:probable endonuclease 4 isoform X1 [Procambarus clarkii]|uniref:probable endonuclease 4 isoform X1 n=2 Tax=Procambarus clarkii TaxID=6728 RepID=UPI003742096F